MAVSIEIAGSLARLARFAGRPSPRVNILEDAVCPVSQKRVADALRPDDRGGKKEVKPAIAVDIKDDNGSTKADAPGRRQPAVPRSQTLWPSDGPMAEIPEAVSTGQIGAESRLNRASFGSRPER